MVAQPYYESLNGIADTLIMTALVFVVSLVIRRDVAFRILSVMAVLSLVSLVGRLAGFLPVARVVDTLVASIPIILAVVFQSDLRRALLSLGKRSLSDSDRDDAAVTVEELMKALWDMAEKHIGALVVVVRRSPIDHIVQVGTEIDTKVTSELLNSIFLPYSPIHDGAVIIQKGKITSAGCLLPLSQNPDIGKSFGTRHRAALGLAELTDAMIVVVSEETGKISLVHDGKISYDVDRSELRRNLKKAIEQKRATAAT